jgi:hypothetical protein
VWTVQRHFNWQKAPDVPDEAQLADFTHPLAKRGEVVCGFKMVPLATHSPGPAEVITGETKSSPAQARCAARALLRDVLAHASAQTQRLRSRARMRWRWRARCARACASAAALR